MILDAFNHFSPARYFEEVCRLYPVHPAGTPLRRLPELWDIEARRRLPPHRPAA